MNNKNSIIINFLKGQGLGNQLWVYYAGIYLSEYFNCNIKFGNGKYFKGYFIIDDKRIENDLIQSQHRFKIKEKYDFFFDLDVTAYSECINNIKDLITNNDIEIIGTLQSVNLIPKNEVIKKTLNFSSLKRLDICCIHIRGGDYKNTIVKPSKKFYTKAIKSVDNIPIKIITDDDKYASSILPKYEIIKNKKSKFDEITNNHHIGNGIKDDFLLLAKSKYSIISSSTFSFWACYIGSIFVKKKIIAPAFWYGNRISTGWWSPQEMYLKNWVYFNSKGFVFKHQITTLPKFIKTRKQNQYLDFLKRKCLNYIFNIINK